MPDRPSAPHLERTADFLERLRRWVEPRQDVRALVIVGSVARGDARPDSDVDVVLLTTDPAEYLECVDWVSDFGVAQSVELEDYGHVTSVRALYGEGLEVEFGVAPAHWASAPFDPGTEEVARHGIVVMLDRDGHAAALAAAVGASWRAGMNDCVFCRILTGIEPGSFVYRDGRCAAFMDIQPVNVGHTLIVPIHHAASLADLDTETAAHLLGVAHGLAAALRRSGLPCEGVNVFLADGAAAGQEVPHTHLHVFPRLRGDGFELRLGPDHTIKPRTELDAAAAAIRSMFGKAVHHGTLP